MESPVLEAVLASEDSVPFTSHERLLESHGVSQWIVCTQDRVGLFGMLAGTLSACGLNIVAAETVTKGSTND